MSLKITKLVKVKRSELKPCCSSHNNLLFILLIIFENNFGIIEMLEISLSYSILFL